MAHAAEWLASARPGYCNITLSDQFGSCEFGDRGAFGLPAAAASVSWEGAASACLELCAHCHRCEYVSLSPQYRDCSWYHRCDLNALHDATVPSPAFRSNAVSARAAPNDPFAPSLEYPARLVRAEGDTGQRRGARGRLRELARELVDDARKICIAPAGVPLGEPQPRAQLEMTERALERGHVRHLPHRLVWVSPVNPDNVAEVFGTLVSAFTLMAHDSPAASFQPLWNYRQRAPIPQHAAALVRHVTRSPEPGPRP